MKRASGGASLSTKGTPWSVAGTRSPVLVAALVLTFLWLSIYLTWLKFHGTCTTQTSMAAKKTGTDSHGGDTENAYTIEGGTCTVGA